jgi:uncharacterized protein YecE (DUF72 family)
MSAWNIPKLPWRFMKESTSIRNFYSGISGVVLPMPKYQFPEEFQKSSRLTYYSSLLNSIEINKSFYKLPRAKTVAKWANEVPEDFKFTFKLWKEITHAKGLAFQQPDVSHFMNAIDNVGQKKGCILIQFAPSMKGASLVQLQHLLATIQSHNAEGAWKVAIEFRDSSWYNEDTYHVTDSFEAAIVIHDKSRGLSPHIANDLKAVYLRFHGPRGDYRGSYSDAFLDEYATYIREWLAEGKSVFAYFNNTMGSAFDNLMTLNKYVRQR